MENTMKIGGCEYTEQQLKSLTPWERSLLDKNPIIAPDGYIPNSVVRRRLRVMTPDPATKSNLLKQDENLADANFTSASDTASVPASASLLPDDSSQSKTSLGPKPRTITRVDSTVEWQDTVSSVIAEFSRKLLPALSVEETKPVEPSQLVSAAGARKSVQQVRTAMRTNSAAPSVTTSTNSAAGHQKQPSVGRSTFTLPAEARTSKTAITDKKHKIGKQHKSKSERADTVTEETSKIQQPTTSVSEFNEGELTLLQRITSEKWFPLGASSPVHDIIYALIQLIDSDDDQIFVSCCHYLVQLNHEQQLTDNFLQMAVDKLSSRISSRCPSIRKTAFWTLKMLNISAQDITVFIWQHLLDVKTAVREELLHILVEMMSGSKFKVGLDCLLSALGIARPTDTKKEQREAITALSDHLQARAEMLASGSREASRQEVEMWLHALKLPQPMGSVRSGENNGGPGGSTLTPSFTGEVFRDEYTGRLVNTPNVSSKDKKEARLRSKKESGQFWRRRNQKMSSVRSKTETPSRIDLPEAATTRGGRPVPDMGRNRRTGVGDNYNLTNGDGRKPKTLIADENMKSDEDFIDKEDKENFNDVQDDWMIMIDKKYGSSTVNETSSISRSGQRKASPVYQLDVTKNYAATLASKVPFRQSVGSEVSEVSAANQMPECTPHVAFTSTNVQDQSQKVPKLPYLSYTWADQSSLPGMTDLRRLQSTPAMDQDRTSEYRSGLGDQTGHAVATDLEGDEDSDSGSLQSLWKSSDVMTTIHERIFAGETIERQARACNAEKLSKVDVQKDDSASSGRGGSHGSFPVISEGSLKRCNKQRCGPHCQQHKWALKKMHHYISISKYLTYTALSRDTLGFTKHNTRKITAVSD